MTIVAMAFLWAGCGGSGPVSSTSGEAAKAAAASAAVRRAAESRAPKGASPALRSVYAEFPPPKPDPEIRGSAAAIAAGKRACAGKTPVQVKEIYFPIALARGKLKAASQEARMIGRINSFERNSAHDVSFAAGQLAADAYQATLPTAIGQFGYQGCVYGLALQLEHRLAPKG